jgi:hypothetical protein
VDQRRIGIGPKANGRFAPAVVGLCQASYKAPGFTGQFEVWLTGTVSPLARQQLTKRGMTVTEEVYKRVEIVD